MLIDSHCHLNRLKLGDETLDVAISRAKARSVTRIISVATQFEENSAICQIAKNHPNVFYSVGVHPSETDGIQPQKPEEIMAFADDDRCVAVGETGLDYYYNDKASFTKQQFKFAIHLEAADKLNKPVIVHTRDAKEDTLAILKEGKIERFGGVLHCFTEDWDMARCALDMGMYLSFSGIVTFKNAAVVQEVAKKVPSDRILVETDAPYLTPVPYRGKPNTPEYVYYVAKFLAELRQEDFDQFCHQTVKNTEKLFKLA